MPRNATDTAAGRMYELDGRQFVSVTTALGALSKPALVPWSAKLTAQRAVEAARDVNTMPMELRPLWVRIGLGTANAKEAEEVRKWISRAPTERRDSAADVGTAVHQAVEAYAIGAPMEAWPAELAEHGRHFSQFLVDWRPDYLEREATVYSLEHGYAGTLDSIARLADGRTYLLDLKTGRDVYPEVALQLAAYRYAEAIRRPDGRLEEMPEVDDVAVLHLTERGYSLRRVRADGMVFERFLAVLEAYEWQHEIGPECLGAPLAPPAAQGVA